MVEVTGIRPAGLPGPARSGAASSGFTVPDGTAAAAPHLAAAAQLDGLLALQEADDPAALDPRARDRRARRQAGAMLEALRDLQLGLLDGPASAGAALRLATLAGQGMDAADPALRAILAALALRAQVELARRGL